MTMRLAVRLCAIGVVFVSASCGDEDILGNSDSGVADSGLADTGVADQGSGDDAAVDNTSYRFVRIEDGDTDPSGTEPGADIDAVGLIKGSADEVYAALVSACEDASGSACTNQTEATGEPDAFPNLPTLDQCSTDGPPYVSLGGEGGFIVLEMPDDIESGDTLNVYEVGNCTTVPGGNTAKAEPLSVYLGASAAGPWDKVTLSGNAPMYVITVP